MSKTGTILDSRPKLIMIQGVIYEVKYTSHIKAVCKYCDCDYSAGPHIGGCRFKCRCVDIESPQFTRVYFKVENKNLIIKPGKLYIHNGMQLYAVKKEESCKGCFFGSNDKCFLYGLVCKGCIPLKLIIGKGV